jgi:hypothetical protein
MSRFLRGAARSLSSFLAFVIHVMGDGLHFLRLAIRSHSTLSAEILFLRKQLAFYEERHVYVDKVDFEDCHYKPSLRIPRSLKVHTVW